MWLVDNTVLAAHRGTLRVLCEEQYQQRLDDFDKIYPDDPEAAAEAKNTYAITVCLRNYKTGEPLDLQPLVDQVNKR